MNDLYKITTQDLHELVKSEVIHVGIYMVGRKVEEYQVKGEMMKHYSPDTYEIINPHLKQIAEGNDTYIVERMNKLNEGATGDFYEPKKYGVVKNNHLQLVK